MIDEEFFQVRINFLKDELKTFKSIKIVELLKVLKLLKQFLI